MGWATLLLQVLELHAYIRQYHILQGVSFDVREGEVTVVLGRNGAGKTTTLRSVLGLTRIGRGEIRLDGLSLVGWRPHEIARLGVGYVPEDRGIFTQLTVEENLQVAERNRGNLRQRSGRIFDLFPDLYRFRHRRAGLLSGGQQQMLAIARVMVNPNRLLLVDEPSKGLAPILVRNVGEALREVAREATVVLVEQNLALAAHAGDRYVIIDDGRSVREGPMAEIAMDRQLQRVYLGVTERNGGLRALPWARR